jgi:hypothetical protein
MKKIVLWFASILADEIKKKLLDTDVKISILNLQPGDRLILRCKTHLSDSAHDHLKKSLEELFPGHLAIVLEEDVEIFAGRDEEHKIIVRYD